MIHAAAYMIIIAILSAGLIAVSAAWLRASTGSPMQVAALTAGATFAGAMALIMGTMSAAGLLPR